MDPSVGQSSSEDPGANNQTRRGQSNSDVVAISDNGARAGDPLRRGNSDGDVLPRGVGRLGQADGETWMDFLRYSGAQGQNQEQIQLALRRAAMMATDRNRRLASYAQDASRRRSSSNLPFPSGRTRVGIPHTGPQAAPASQDNGNGLQIERITDRPLPRRPSASFQHNRRGQEVILPKWQPDHEVTKCPICKTAFSFWYRKHHCRKCGRVVCANCSPHRITIPRQFIVHPPDDSSSVEHPRADGIEVVDLTGGSESPPGPLRRRSGNGRDRGIDPSLGGGQEVRLCNPCVPDPNPLPHLDHAAPRYTLDSFPRPETLPQVSPNTLIPPRNSSLQRPVPQPPRRGSSSRHHHDNRSLFTFEPHEINGSNPIPDFIRHRERTRGSQSSVTSVNLPSAVSVSASGPESSLHNRNLTALLNEQRSSYPRHRQHASTGHIPDHGRPPFISGDGMRPAPSRRPQPELREEDECPICHSALPAKGPNGSETAREQHVTDCIESHFSSSGPRTSNAHPSAATAAAVVATSATPTQAGATANSAVSTGPSPSESLPPASNMARRRTTGMVIYHASEKDCVGEDGDGTQECVICFEEFAVGDEMGRLECLCKFHKMCIRQWWDTKGPGSCPVHQGGL